MSKTRTPVGAACLIMIETYGRAFPMQPPARGGDQWPLSCAALIPSLPGAYDGRPKWAAVDVMWSSVDSLTTPSWEDEAQAESSHAITKATVPQHTTRLFTKPNLLITQCEATSETRALMLEESRREKLLRRNRSSRLVLHGRQLGRA